MRLFYINNDGSSYGNYIDVREGTTVAQFVQEKTGRPSDQFVIRVTTPPAAPRAVAAEEVLRENDRVSVTPKKVTGAAAA